MTFARQKRLLLGWLALLAPVPLPFNTVLEWPALFLYTLLVLYYLQRSESGATNWLPNWALNVMGGVYLPLFLLDVRLSVTRNSPVKALLHLILFLVIVKLYSIRREKDKWHLMVAIFFVFIGAMATSSHVTISIYLLAFMVLGLYVLAQLAHLHVLTSMGQQKVEEATAKRPAFSVGRPLWIGTLLIIVIGVPLFASMPRVREPYILGRGGLGIGRTTGFSDSVDLGVTSRIRGNRNVALRVQYAAPIDSSSELRFKGATFEYYRNRRWFRELRQHGGLRPRGDGYYQASLDTTVDDRRQGTTGRSANEAIIFLEPLGNNSLVVPIETQAVKVGSRAITADPGGALLLPAFRRRDTLRFEVELSQKPVIAGILGQEGSLSALEIGEEVTPRIRQLARQIMGDGGDQERINRLLGNLLREYSYTDDFTGRDGQNPLEDFLFVYRSGHCEYFATVMVLMLRSQGIPARYVSGFLGAELNPIEDYYVVRQENAHAWVEAYTEETGWQVYDPTPPEGRPSISPQSLSLLFRQMADFVKFRWDRYVLSYGAEDQKSLIDRLRESLQEWWIRFNDEASESDIPIDAGGAALESTEALGPEAKAWRPEAYQLGLFVLAILATVGFVYWRQQRAWTASRSYLWLRHLLARVSDEADETVTPLRLQELALARYPNAETDVSQLVQLYLRESFAAQPLNAEESTRLSVFHRSIGQAEKEARKLDRQRAKAAKRKR